MLNKIKGKLREIEDLRADISNLKFEIESDFDVDVTLHEDRDGFELQVFTNVEVELVTGKEPIIETRDSGGYPYKAYAIKDGIKVFAILTKDEYDEYKKATAGTAAKESFDTQ